jgi:hypothetical protein
MSSKRRRNFVVGLVLFGAALALFAQNSTIRNLAHDTTPLSTDAYLVSKLGQNRDKYQLATDMLGVAIQSLTLSAPSPLGCTPSPATATAGSASITCAWATGLTNGNVLAVAGGTIVLQAISGVMLPIFVASGAGHAQGAVPDPGASAGTTHYLREDATWQVPPSSTGTVTSVGESWGTGLGWISVSPSSITTSGTFAHSVTTGQTSHQVIGTCGAATTYGPCSLVAGDLPAVPLGTGVSGTLLAASFPALTGAVTTSAGSLSTVLASGLTIGTPTLTTPVLNTPTIGTAASGSTAHIKILGSAPGSLSCTSGLCGTTGSVAATGSDAAFELTITVSGTGMSTNGGFVSWTYNSAYVTNPPVCSFGLASGTGNWPTTTTVPELTSQSTTVNTLEIDTTLGLTAGNTYRVDVVCFQR